MHKSHHTDLPVFHVHSIAPSQRCFLASLNCFKHDIILPFCEARRQEEWFPHPIVVITRSFTSLCLVYIIHVQFCQ